MQRRYYAVGNEITRIEQDILHHQERQTQWENDLKQTNGDWQLVRTQMDESEDELRELEHDLQTLTPQLETAIKETVSMQAALKEAEEAMQSWQARWDEFNQQSAKTTQAAQVEKTNIQHLEQRIGSLQRRQEQLLQDQGRFSFTQLTEELEEFSKKSFEVTEKLEFQKEKLADARQEISTLQAAQQDSNQHLDTLRSDLQKLRGQQASLEALQQTALGQRDNATAPWVTKHSLDIKTPSGPTH